MIPAFRNDLQAYGTAIHTIKLYVTREFHSITKIKACRFFAKERSTLLVRCMCGYAASGIPAVRWFTGQLPGDYTFSFIFPFTSSPVSCTMIMEKTSDLSSPGTPLPSASG